MKINKLRLNRETLVTLQDTLMEGIQGGNGGKSLLPRWTCPPSGASVMICGPTIPCNSEILCDDHQVK